MKGFVYQRGSKWYYKFRGPERDPSTGEHPWITRGGFDTKKAAWQDCREVMGEADRGRVIRPSTRTVSQFFAEWFAAVSRRSMPQRGRTGRSPARSLSAAPHAGADEHADFLVGAQSCMLCDMTATSIVTRLLNDVYRATRSEILCPVIYLKNPRSMRDSTESKAVRVNPQRPRRFRVTRHQILSGTITYQHRCSSCVLSGDDTAQAHPPR